MGMSCKICNDPRRLSIDRALVEGGNISKIAQQYGVPYHALYNHQQNHLSRQLVTAYEKRDMAQNMDLLNRIDTMITRAEDIFQRNYNKKRDGMALKALGEQRLTLELLCKISAYLHEARLLELRAKQGDFEALRKNEQEEFTNLICDRLNPAEIDVFMMLAAKVEGEIDGDVAEYKTPAYERIPELVYKKWHGEPITINVESDEEAPLSQIARLLKRTTFDDETDDAAGKDEPAAEEDEQISTIEEDLPDQGSNEPITSQEPEQEQPATTMTRRKPLSKIYYGPNMPEHTKRRAAKAYVRQHGRLPDQQWLRDAL